MNAHRFQAMGCEIAYRKRIPYGIWRKAHYANFAVWTLASVHGVMSGTDRGVWWLAIIYGFSIAAVVTLRVWRFGGKSLNGGWVVRLRHRDRLRGAAPHRRAAPTTRHPSGTHRTSKRR